jgi:Fe-S-cluster-containing hydrogenase component 2
MDLFDRFNTEKCTLCGECFHQCPVMHLSLEAARAEIVRLTTGRETEHVLQ